MCNLVYQHKHHNRMLSKSQNIQLYLLSIGGERIGNSRTKQEM
jgi:hypothetical protein